MGGSGRLGDVLRRDHCGKQQGPRGKQGAPGEYSTKRGESEEGAEEAGLGESMRFVPKVRRGALTVAITAEAQHLLGTKLEHATHMIPVCFLSVPVRRSIGFFLLLYQGTTNFVC